jgi:hypothetical protein
MLANYLSLTVHRSTTDADGLELTDRPVELLTANSAKPFNAGVKSLRATLPDEIFLLGILLLEP